MVNALLGAATVISFVGSLCLGIAANEGTECFCGFLGGMVCTVCVTLIIVL